MPDTSVIDALTLILAAVAPGRSVVAAGAPDDTRAALEALGARIDPGPGRWTVCGTGNGCLLAAPGPLAFGDDADAAALVTGLVGTYAMPTRLACSGPAPETLFAALASQGTQISPVDAHGWTVEGPPSAHPVEHEGDGWDEVTVLAVILAALNVPGQTRVTGLRRDFADIVGVLDRFDAGVDIAPAPDGTFALRVTGQSLLSPSGGTAP